MGFLMVGLVVLCCFEGSTSVLVLDWSCVCSLRLGLEIGMLFERRECYVELNMGRGGWGK